MDMYTQTCLFGPVEIYAKKLSAFRKLVAATTSQATPPSKKRRTPARLLSDQPDASLTNAMLLNVAGIKLPL